MFRILIELFVLYLLYKIIFDFVIPVYHTTKQVKQKMNQMQQQMNQQARQQQDDQFNAHTKETSARPAKEDYIEFEELK